MLQIYDFSFSWQKQGKTFPPLYAIEIFSLSTVKCDKWFCFCFSRKTLEKWLAMFFEIFTEWKTSKQFHPNCETRAKSISQALKNNFSINPKVVLGKQLCNLWANLPAFFMCGWFNFDAILPFWFDPNCLMPKFWFSF